MPADKERAVDVRRAEVAPTTAGAGGGAVDRDPGRAADKAEARKSCENWKARMMNPGLAFEASLSGFKDCGEQVYSDVAKLA